jgi:DNA-binding NarL/FixJ family response regulator
VEKAATAQSSPRFLIADDHAIFAETFKSFLELTYPVVGIVGDGRALIEEANRLNPDVIIVDIGLPLLNGFEAARRIHQTSPTTKFVILTMQDDPNLAAAALQELGPIGFVLKRSGGAEVMRAIDSVLRGNYYLTPELRSEGRVESNPGPRQFSRELTSRQRDVLQLYAEGRSIKEIARLLSLSEKTVEFHKYHIMQSYGLKTNADLVLFALKQGAIFMNPDL